MKQITSNYRLAALAATLLFVSGTALADTSEECPLPGTLKQKADKSYVAWDSNNAVGPVWKGTLNPGFLEVQSFDNKRAAFLDTSVQGASAVCVYDVMATTYNAVGITQLILVRVHGIANPESGDWFYGASAFCSPSHGDCRIRVAKKPVDSSPDTNASPFRR